ncbi:MAG: thioredoxin-disulfide reductase [Lachnospiraceae bacterium]|nr:thioredoxin-disulfide reductase [Lachnospiraceae bacterium]
MFDIVIIGSGPAGLTAAIYAKRAMLKVLVIEKQGFGGGQIVSTDKVDNYPGLPQISGFDLALSFCEHAEKLGVEIESKEVIEIQDKQDLKEVVLSDGRRLQTKNVLIATGAKHRKLGVPGEDTFSTAGVSYCATCDGNFYKDKEVAVVGGGDTALGDALYLSNLCKKVHLIHRRDSFRGSKTAQEEVRKKENISLHLSCEVSEIIGEQAVEKIRIKNTESSEVYDIPVSGVFVAVGMQPVTEFVKDLVELDAGGYIIAGEEGITSREGVYVAGDVRTKALRQIVTAVSDGANVIHHITESSYNSKH